MFRRMEGMIHRQKDPSRKDPERRILPLMLPFINIMTETNKLEWWLAFQGQRFLSMKQMISFVIMYKVSSQET